MLKRIDIRFALPFFSCPLILLTNYLDILSLALQLQENGINSFIFNG